MKTTLAPWTLGPVVENKHGQQVRTIIHPHPTGETFVAQVMTDHFSENIRAESDAAMIAAAPTLYDACLFAYEMAMSEYGPESDLTIKLKSALNKAVGKYGG